MEKTQKDIFIERFGVELNQHVTLFLPGSSIQGKVIDLKDSVITVESTCNPDFPIQTVEYGFIYRVNKK